MASSTWRNILLAQQAGKNAGEALGGIGDSIDRGFNGGMNTQERAMRQFQLQDEQRKLANELRLKALLNPEAGIIPLQPGQQMEGDLQPTGFDGFGFSKAARDAELKRQLDHAISVEKAKYAARPKYKYVQDQFGNWVQIEEGTAASQPVLAPGASTQLQGNLKRQLYQKLGPDGVKHVYDARTNEDLGAAESLKGVVQMDAAGNMWVVDNRLQEGSSPGLAGAITAPTPASTQGAAAPVSQLKGVVSGGKLVDSDITKISAWDAMIDDLQRVEKLLEGKDDRVGPVAGRAYNLKRGIPGFEMDEGTSDLFSAIGSISAAQLHEKYGGALTGSELGRAGKWSISENDKAIDLKSKIKQALQEAKSQRENYLKNLSVKGVDVSKFSGGFQGAPATSSADNDPLGILAK